MTNYMDLVGRKDEVIEKELLNSHSKILTWLGVASSTNSWESINELQNSLMDATGYTSKNVLYSGKETIVIFNKTLFPSKDLAGKGENELEAICNACQNLIEHPYDYNTHSKKYFDMLKK